MGSKRRIRVLVVDDSLFMRAAIKNLLDETGEFEVVDTAKDGQDAVDKVPQARPDVITMDFNMPRLNGAQAVKAIMASHPTPVIMFSAHTLEGARETFEALNAGAVDFCTKPAGEVSSQLAGIADELRTKLRAAAQSSPRGLTRPAPSSSASLRKPRMSTLPPSGARVLIIGISTGGPAALSRLIPELPASLRSSVIIVQHMPPAFTATLAERLNAGSKVEVREAQEGDRPMPGMVLVAPGGKHLEVDASGVLRLTDGPLVHGCRPAADVTMKSAAAAYGRRAVGLVMTGMGKDGAAGLAAIRSAAGKTFVQDKESCVIYGMPKAALELGVVDEVITLDNLATRIQGL
jgi:two-component system chemotaxis response regulator CheB